MEEREPSLEIPDTGPRIHWALMRPKCRAGLPVFRSGPG